MTRGFAVAARPTLCFQTSHVLRTIVLVSHLSLLRKLLTPTGSIVTAFSAGTLNVTNYGEDAEIATFCSGATFVWQGDANLVLYDPDGDGFASGSGANGCATEGCTLTFGPHGDLVEYVGGQPLVDFKTYDEGAETLLVYQTAPYIQIVAANGTTIFEGGEYAYFRYTDFCRPTKHNDYYGRGYCGPG